MNFMDEVHNNPLISKKFLDSNIIKLIAIIAMTIDHLAWAIFPGYSLNPIAIVMHIIGRITCPIMCFFVAEGYFYTRNIKKYTRRIFLFALISHVPYILNSIQFKEFGYLSLMPFVTGNGFFGHVLNQTSVMWSLAIGLVMLRVNDSEKINQKLKLPLILFLCLVSFMADWSCIASMVVFVIGTNRNNKLKQILWSLFFISLYALVYFFALSRVYGLIQLGVILSLPVLYFYNGKRGANKKVNTFMKWFFYTYYPLHLLIIFFVFILK